jgi:hypothetical protein
MLKSKIQKNVTHGTFGKKKFSKERHAHIFFLFSDLLYFCPSNETEVR